MGTGWYPIGGLDSTCSGLFDLQRPRFDLRDLWIETAMTDTLLYAGAGLLVGTMVGLTGVGGGSMMTPILMLLFGQSPSVAVGTDLLFSATTKLVASASFGFSRRSDCPFDGRLLLGSVPGSSAVGIGTSLAR